MPACQQQRQDGGSSVSSTEPCQVTTVIQTHAGWANILLKQVCSSGTLVLSVTSHSKCKGASHRFYVHSTAMYLGTWLASVHAYKSIFTLSDQFEVEAVGLRQLNLTACWRPVVALTSKQGYVCESPGSQKHSSKVPMQDGWKRWKKALKESNQLDDEGFEDEAARAAAKMVADAHKNFGSKPKGKGKRAAAADEDDAEPFSLLHKVGCCPAGCTNLVYEASCAV